MGKNGLLFRLQRRLLLADRNGALLTTTSELAELVARAVKTREPGQDPATRTFQLFGFSSTPSLKSCNRR
jgi:16S rRNA (cytosine1402-N4)-methyltransferase